MSSLRGFSRLATHRLANGHPLRYRQRFLLLSFVTLSSINQRMTTELPKAYDPAESQSRWVQHWLSNGYCNADPNPQKQSHTIMIPLPNVTGALHMGHCLNGTVQDLLTRWRRMQGREALWMPGTDHAGIATQAVVERRMLEEEGKTRHDIGREALVERIWKWKNEYEARILNQLQQIGSSCDWRRVRFTLDEVCSKAVRRTFFKMFSDGLIYRGKRLVNWDTYLQTAVADDEVYTDDIQGHFWTMNYPVVELCAERRAEGVSPPSAITSEVLGGLTPTARQEWEPTGQRISFSTTRPETMLGDTAVCVHPTDERYIDLVGKHVMIPANGRIIPIVADALLADKTLGTGAVKVTPAHDPNDYACWTRNKDKMSEPINIMNPDGTINENGGEFAGLDRYEARKQVVAKMESLGHLEKVEERIIPMKYSDRSKTPIEPFLSDQWFVKMDKLAQDAIDAVEDGRVRFFPQRYAKTYVDWLAEKRDWCISRQLWWGHRIPIWSKTYESVHSEKAINLREIGSKALREIVGEAAGHQKTMSADGQSDSAPSDSNHWSGRWTVSGVQLPLCYSIVDDIGDQKRVMVCVDIEESGYEAALVAAGFTQDPDVLDTWFSSALWPHATLGWPDLEHNPPMVGMTNDQNSMSNEDTRRADALPLAGESENRKLKTKNEVLDFFYPGSVLVTSRDIITLWVARMVLTGLYNMGDVPFSHVYIHPKILDGLGQTMSKSKGNGVDPLELIDKYGTDAVRFTIASLCGETQDVRLPVGYECPHCQAVTPQTKEHQDMKPMGGPKPSIKCAKCKKTFQFPSPWFTPDDGAAVARIVSERFEYGRNFCNKLWNACRFAFMNLEGFTPAPVAEADLQVEDRWILSRLATTVREVTTMLDRYQFDQATRAVRDFTWNEFCDWYLELLKPRFRNEAAKPVAQRVLVRVIDALLRLLHPFAPFITEELWHKLNELAPIRGLARQMPAEESVMIAQWPEVPASRIDAALEKRFERLQETIVAVRNVRSVYGIAPGAPLKLFMRCAPDVAEQLKAVAEQFDFLSKTMLEAAGLDVTAPEGSVSFSLPDADGYIPVGDSIDREAVRKNKEKEAEKLRGFIAGAEKKLANEGFMAKAPADVVEGIRATKAEQEAQLASIERIIRDLS
jgi:valyl-tRNA synthetase